MSESKKKEMACVFMRERIRFSPLHVPPKHGGVGLQTWPRAAALESTVPTTYVTGTPSRLAFRLAPEQPSVARLASHAGIGR